MLNKCFYTINEICPDLGSIYLNDLCLDIREEIMKNSSGWISWPEKLVESATTMEWKIIPLCVFGTWKNADKFPILSQFLRSIPGLKLAGISKLGPKTKLLPHKGWAEHSNYHIRCHFGIDVPDGCHVIVKDDDSPTAESQQHYNNNWLIFDDSKVHTAINNSNIPRIVLILDVVRPASVKRGTALGGDTQELLNFINSV